MAKRKRAPDDGPNGVDRFSCNGYGLVVDGKKVEPIRSDEKDIDVIEELEETDE